MMTSNTLDTLLTEEDEQVPSRIKARPFARRNANNPSNNIERLTLNKTASRPNASNNNNLIHAL